MCRVLERSTRLDKYSYKLFSTQYTVQCSIQYGSQNQNETVILLEKGLLGAFGLWGRKDETSKKEKGLLAACRLPPWISLAAAIRQISRRKWHTAPAVLKIHGKFAVIFTSRKSCFSRFLNSFGRRNPSSFGRRNPSCCNPSPYYCVVIKRKIADRTVHGSHAKSNRSRDPLRHLLATSALCCIIIAHHLSRRSNNLEFVLVSLPSHTKKELLYSAIIY